MGAIRIAWAAVAVGATIGRLLPSLLVGIALSVALSVAFDAALPHWVESVELSQSESVVTGEFPLNTGHQYRAQDGTPINDEEAEAIYQAVYEQHGPEPDPSLLPVDVFFGIAASRYPEVLARESAAIGVATVLVGALAAIIVRRRRPE